MLWTYEQPPARPTTFFLECFSFSPNDFNQCLRTLRFAAMASWALGPWGQTHQAFHGFLVAAETRRVYSSFVGIPMYSWWWWGWRWSLLWWWWWWWWWWFVGIPGSLAVTTKKAQKKQQNPTFSAPKCQMSEIIELLWNHKCYICRVPSSPKISKWPAPVGQDEKVP